MGRTIKIKQHNPLPSKKNIAEITSTAEGYTDPAQYVALVVLLMLVQTDYKYN